MKAKLQSKIDEAKKDGKGDKTSNDKDADKKLEKDNKREKID